MLGTRHNVPIMRRSVQPGEPDFDDVFDRRRAVRGQSGSRRAVASRAWWDAVSFASGNPRLRRTMLGDRDQTGGADERRRRALHRRSVPLPGDGARPLNRLGRGDPRLFERMERVSEPGRRPAGILFADLEASGALSRRLSSRGYFGLISDVTDLIDSAVIARNRMVGKHAGDGGSALFLAADSHGSESAAARAAIEAARAIRDGAESLGPDDVSVEAEHRGALGSDADGRPGRHQGPPGCHRARRSDERGRPHRGRRQRRRGPRLQRAHRTPRLKDARRPASTRKRSLTRRSAKSKGRATKRSATPERSRRRNLTGAEKQPSNGASSNNARLLMRLRGVEPPRPVRATRPSTLRVYQFRHSRLRAVDSRRPAPSRPCIRPRGGLLYEHVFP